MSLLEEMLRKSKETAASLPKPPPQQRSSVATKHVFTGIWESIRDIWKTLRPMIVTGTVSMDNIEVEARLGMIVSQSSRLRHQSQGKFVAVITDAFRSENNIKFDAGVDVSHMECLRETLSPQLCDIEIKVTLDPILI